MESYLSGRTQSTLVDGHLSSALPLPPCSVIQGGIGSGLLYLVYTNDLPDVTHDHEVDYNEAKAHCKEIIQPHSVNTRAAAQGSIRYGDHFRGESEQTRSSFKYRAMKYYNSLPEHPISMN